MFDSNNHDQQPSGNTFTPPGMAPVVDHSLPMVSPDPAGAPSLQNDQPAAPLTPGPDPADHHEPQHTAIPVDQDDPLLSIKRDALQHLTPLVGHLDQTAEEKFRTTMMMIQASDDHSLIQVAYDAAQNIEDEKVRAQALLDVINEINYFTQQK